jgi:hypothetical protein
MVIISPGSAYQLAQNHQLATLQQSHLSAHFTWGEVFTQCRDAEIQACPLSCFENAFRQAETMEQVRALWDRPLAVHSWYRDAAHNRRIGGAPKSYHLQGLATDFHIHGFEGIQGNKAIQHTLDQVPFMQVCGLEFTGGNWTHVDSRGVGARFGNR